MPVVVIVGPPASGKSTELRRRAEALRSQGCEPITLDYDDLAVCFGSQAPTGHGHADHFTELVQRTRGLAIRLALQAAQRYDADVLIVDSSPPRSRRDAYAAAGAELVTLDTSLEECHRRADAAGRPPEWHELIDSWAPEQETAGWGWEDPRRSSRRTPVHRKGAKGWAYEQKRKAFLAQYTNCQAPGCGKPFVTDAPCEHNACAGKGCHYFHAYPTVQHTTPLVEGSTALDVSTWLAYCSACNTSDGARIGNRRRAGRHASEGPGVCSEMSLDW